MRWSVRKLFNGVGDCGHMCLEVVLSKLGPKLLCHSPGLFHSFQPRAHSSGQGTVALDSTREGQPCDFNQAKTPVSELFCIFSLSWKHISSDLLHPVWYLTADAQA